MRTIWKFPLKIRDEQTIMVPTTSENGGPDFLHAGCDALGHPCIWLEVDDDGERFPIKVYMVGTGHPVPQEASQHLTSFLQGTYVWHVYV